jgi:translation initiation factor 2 beta subunit (eIF-2beta)/eIF-5
MDKYSEEFLINRLYDIIGKTYAKNIIQPPKPESYILNKKTFITNYNKLEEFLKRDYIISFTNYIEKELTIETSINGEGHLILSRMIKSDIIEKTIKNYCIKFIQCKSCKGGNTIILKEDKILFIFCNVCKSKNSIQIK